MGDWVDISVPLYTGMAHWPGDRPFELHRELDIRAGAECNLSWYSTSAHAGTHMDAPLHFLDGGASMEQLPLDRVMGPSRVIGIANAERIPISELEPHQIQPGERILFKTVNSDTDWHNQPFRKRFVAIPADTAAYLAQRRPALVGVDYLSVGAFEGDGAPSHRALLGAGIWLVEGLNLGAVSPGDYELICLPLRMVGSEGAPARAILRKI